MNLKDIIPKGMYCYDHLDMSKDGWSGKCVGMCPFWNRLKNKHEQESGYCTYMQKGDWGDSGTFVLWDQVKECDVNHDSDHDWEHHIIHD